MQSTIDSGPDAQDVYLPPDRAETDRPPTAADRILIDELFARYAWAIDTGDVDAFAELFVPGAAIEDTVVKRRFDGPDGPRAFATYFRDRVVFPGRQHWVGQAVMTMVDDDTCHVRSFGMASHLYPTGANYLTYLGSYADEVVRTDEGWKFRQRRYFAWRRDTYRGYVHELDVTA